MAIDYRQLVLDMYNAANPDLPEKATQQNVYLGSAGGTLTPTEENGYRNTIAYISANDESEDMPFQGSIECRYTRLDPKISDGNVNAGERDWEDDEAVEKYIEGLLKKNYPDDEIYSGSIQVGRSYPNNTMVLHVRFDHFKFVTPGDVEINLTVVEGKTDLSTTNGNLDGFKQ